MTEPFTDDPARWLVSLVEEELPPDLRHRPSALGLLFEARREGCVRYVSERHVRGWKDLDWRQQPADEWRFFVRWGQHTGANDGSSYDCATILRASTFRTFLHVWLVRFEDVHLLPPPDA